MAQSDIVPPHRNGRSIRNISPSERRRRTRPKRDVPDDLFESDRPKRGRGAIWVLAILALAGLAVAVSFLLTGATVTVTPKTRTVTIEGTFTATKGAGLLSFETLEITEVAETDATPTGEENVSEHATGEIIVYNDYNDKPQRLITNTRFESPDGLIYRIRKPIVVPGQSTENGQTLPGSITATVYADEPGETYNIGLVDFTIPGFKGSPQYEGFFARSKTPMTGGFEGVRKVLAEEEEAALRQTLREEARTRLEGNVLGEVPDGFYYTPTLSMITYRSLPHERSGDAVRVREEGVLHGIIFDSKVLAAFIAERSFGDVDGAGLDIYKADDLTLRIVSESETPWIEDELEIAFSGEVTIIWDVDSEALAEALAGSSKEATDMILSGFPGIETAHVSVRPFWKGSYPEEAADIAVTLANPRESLTP